MARDIRDLFKQAQVIHEDMPNNHEARFLEKLETALPEAQPTSKVNWLNIAASVVVLIGLSFGAYKFITPDTVVDVADNTIPLNVGALGKVSPDLKKVEDYYLASIHLELSKMKPTAETKVVFDGYLEQLNTLDQEYKTLSLELTENGITELTITALIDNLRFRLNLLYRLKNQLKTLDASKNSSNEAVQTS
jgi:hypothetical protein